MNFLVVGVEFEYSNSRQKEDELVPGLATSMFNGIVSTPTTGIQFYGTIGGGFYRERLGEDTETSFGTNIGGGAKVTIAGPLRLRIDYRVFNLRGGAQHKTPQRFYAGLNCTLLTQGSDQRSRDSPIRSMRTVAAFRLS